MGSALQMAGGVFTGIQRWKADQYNAKIDRMSAQDALARGQLPESMARARGTRTVGAASAAYASGGVDVKSGSAVDVAAGTRGLSALDAATVRFNALREAYGYNLKAQQSDAAAAPDLIGSLLTGGGQAAGSMYQTYGLPQTSVGSDPPYYVAAPGASYDPSTMPSFVRG
jgi:hypothetical protein